MGLEKGREVPLEEAAASWYDNVYLLIEGAIGRHRVLDQMPGWTLADLYVEIARRWLELSEGGAPAGPVPAVEALLRETDRSWWQRRQKIRISG